MKVRNGFVSNSSSSSFAIFGLELSEEELNAISNDGVDGDPRDIIEESGLEYYSFDGYGAAVGISIQDLWRQLPDELKEKALGPIKSKLEKLLKRPVHVEFVSGEYPT